jgi:hypothetical protein
MSEQTFQGRLEAEAAAEVGQQQELPVEPAVEAASVEQAEASVASEETQFTEEDKEALNKALRAERKRARDLEKQVKEFQSKVEKLDQEDLGEQEKALAEAVATARAEAKAEFDGKMLKLRVESKAAGMNFHDPALTMGLLEVEADATDDEILDALKELAEARPYLVKSVRPDVGPGPRPGKDGGMSGVSDENWFRDLLAKK